MQPHRRFLVSEIYPVPTDMKARTLIDEATYESMYQRSIADPDGFWSEQAEAFLFWQKPWQTVSKIDMPSGNIRWFDGGHLGRRRTGR